MAYRLDTLADVLAGTQAPAVVVAAIVQAEILSLDAFAPASGVVARAAARLTLIQRGLDPKSLVVIEVGHLELVAESSSALAGYRAGEPAGVCRLDPALRSSRRARSSRVAGDLRGDPAWMSGRACRATAAAPLPPRTSHVLAAGRTGGLLR